jgi:AbrB family looped-hinge helix DNA binding protein
MVRPQSRLTAQGQISVPAEIRRKLGLGPGSMLEWDEENGQVIVRKSGRFSSEDIHKAAFVKRPSSQTLDDLKNAIRKHVRDKHARG